MNLVGPELPELQFVDHPDESDLNGGVSPYGRSPIPTNMAVFRVRSQ